MMGVAPRGAPIQDKSQLRSQLPATVLSSIRQEPVGGPLLLFRVLLRVTISGMGGESGFTGLLPGVCSGSSKYL